MRPGNEKPVDWLAANGMTSYKDSVTQQTFVRLPEDAFNALVVRRAKESGTPRKETKELVSRQLGYESYQELRDHMVENLIWNSRSYKKKRRKIRLLKLIYDFEKAKMTKGF